MHPLFCCGCQQLLPPRLHRTLPLLPVQAQRRAHRRRERRRGGSRQKALCGAAGSVEHTWAELFNTLTGPQAAGALPTRLLVTQAALRQVRKAIGR